MSFQPKLCLMKNLYQVLLVDDDTNANNQHARKIKESGFTSCVKVALNGGHALLYLNQIFQDVRDDRKLLILLDTDMPIMNGLDFLKHYERCEYPCKKNIEIVVMVARDLSSFELELMKSMGVRHFLQKPLDPKHLFDIVNESKLLAKVA